MNRPMLIDKDWIDKIKDRYKYHELPIDDRDKGLHLMIALIEEQLKSPKELISEAISYGVKNGIRRMNGENILDQFLKEKGIE